MFIVSQGTHKQGVQLGIVVKFYQPWIKRKTITILIRLIGKKKQQNSPPVCYHYSCVFVS